jgi:hypothetical protein
MRPTLSKIWAFICVLAFFSSCVVLGDGAGPRNPGPDINVSPADVVFKVDGLPVTQAIIGTSVAVNVTVRNSGNLPSTTVSILIVYDTNQYIAQGNLTAQVDPAGTGSFETMWDTSVGNLLPGDHIVNVTVTEAVSGDDNPNNNLASTVLTLLPVPKPIVYVDEITLPANGMVGDVVKITAKLKNKGTKDQTDPADGVMFYLGTTALTKDPIPYQVPLYADDVTSVTVDYLWTTTTAGRYAIVVEVQSSRLKTLSHDINLTSPIENVYISRVDVDKTLIDQDDTITVSARLKNNGTKTAGETEIWLLLDSASSPSSANYSAFKSNIPKGDIEVSVSFMWNSSEAPPGNHTFTVRVLGSSDINAARTSPMVTVKPKVPKMAMTSFKVLPEVVNSGQTAILSAVLENSGAADAYNLELKFFLSSTDSYPLGLKKVNVKKGTSVMVNLSYNAETGENDTRLNFFAQFEETIMNDSLLVKTTVPLRPDLSVTSASFPTQMVKDQEYPVSAVIANTGKADSPNFTVKLNLGADLPYLAKDISLPAGQTITVNWTVTPTVAGTRLKLRVEVDAFRNVTESDEFNNVYESGPDITVNAASLAFIELQSVNSAQKSYTTSLGTAATVKLTVTLHNKGAKDGKVLLTIKEGPTTVTTLNITVQANQTSTVTYKWNITGTKTHTAKVELSGMDAGLVTSRIISVDLKENPTFIPGFELLAVAAALSVMALLVRKKRL